MKLKTISSIFNRNKRLVIYTAENGEQWIGNGIAAYSLRGMPQMTPEIVLRIFDVPAEKYNKWICKESELPSTISFEDNALGETDIEPLKTNIEWYGVNHWLFPDGQRIYSFNEDYIKPLLDEPDYLTYHKRETTGGGFVLACKIGLEIKAIIAPVMLKEDFTRELYRIADLYKAMEREKVVNAAYELYGIEDDEPPEIDPETGEVLDSQLEFGEGGGDNE